MWLNLVWVIPLFYLLYPYWGVLSHAAFIAIFSLFVHSLAQTALRLRDSSRG